MVEIWLDLPPSKNRRTRTFQRRTATGKVFHAPVVTKEVRDYRARVGEMLAPWHGKLPTDQKIILDCVWYKTRVTQDCSNFHDELCDAVAPALGLDDRMFLVRDMDFVIEKPRHKNAGKVWLQIRTMTGVK